MTNKFRICRKCGNLVGMVHDSGVPMMCCGQPMDVLEPNTSEGAGEKHLPVVSLDGDTLSVNVGSVDHQCSTPTTSNGSSSRQNTAACAKPESRRRATRRILPQKRQSRGRLRLLQPPRPVDDRSVNAAQ